MSEPEPLVDVAAAIADGTPVDWSRAALDVDALRADDGARLLRRLQNVERLVRGHDMFRSHGAGTDARRTPRAAPQRMSAIDGVEVHWGPFVVLEKIGHGSFGDVYRAWDPRIEREVALKLIGDTLMPGDALRAIEEARRLARVAHPNVVAVYGAELVDDRVGIWMQFVRGRTLDEDIRAHGPMSGREVMRVGVEVARALEAVHGAGLVHGDVKAQNVLRDTAGRILLSDFGTSVERRQGEASGGRVGGTPLYLAPELLAGSSASVSADLYSLGVLLYYLASGTYPVLGGSLDDIRRVHAEGASIPLAKRRRGLPRRLLTVVNRLLRPVPAERFIDARSVERALSGRLDPPAARRRRAAWALSVLAMAGAVGFWSWRLVSPGPVPGGSEFRRQVGEPPCAGAVATTGWMACIAPRGAEARSVLLFNPATRETRPVPTVGPAPVDVLLSPSGEQLAYTTAPRPGSQAIGVHLRTLRTGDDRFVAELPEDAAPIQLRTWRRDGRTLEFYLRKRDGTAALDALDLASGALNQVFAFPDIPQGHATSPDGRTLAFDMVDPHLGTRDIRVCALASGTCDTVAAHPDDDFMPYWAPDGRLLFVSDRGGTFAWYLTRMDGIHGVGQPQLVVDLGRSWFVRPLGFDRLGEFFYLSLGSGADVFTADVWPAVSRPAPVVRFSASVTGPARSAVWSPDGRLLAYVSQRSPFAERGSTRVRVVRAAEGSTVQDIPVDLRFNASRLAWSPDGRRLALRTLLGDPAVTRRQGIHLVDITQGRVVKSLFSSRSPTGDVAWLDDRTVAFALVGGVNVFDVVTNEERALWSAPIDQQLLGFALSPDRQHLALTVGARNHSWTAVALLSIADRSLHELLRRDQLVQALDWTPSGREVLVNMPTALASSAAPELWSVPVDGGPRERLNVAFDGLNLTGARVHPDGHRLLMDLADNRSDVFIMGGLPR